MPRSASVPVGEQEKKSNASRELLLDATDRLLSERATLDVSLSEIAKASGLNSALIKYYFGNKEGLLLALLERHAERQMGALNQLVGMDLSADQKLKVHISGIVNAYYRSPYLNRLIHYIIEMGRPESSKRVVEIFVLPMVAAYDAIISQGVREGRFRRVDPAFLYFSLVGSCDIIFQSAVLFGPVLHEKRLNEDLKRRYVEHVRGIVLRGLAPDGDGSEA